MMALCCKATAVEPVEATLMIWYWFGGGWKQRPTWLFAFCYWPFGLLRSQIEYLYNSSMKRSRNAISVEGCVDLCKRPSLCGDVSCWLSIDGSRSVCFRTALRSSFSPFFYFFLSFLDGFVMRHPLRCRCTTMTTTTSPVGSAHDDSSSCSSSSCNHHDTIYRKHFYSYLIVIQISFKFLFVSSHPISFARHRVFFHQIQPSWVEFLQYAATPL